MGEREPERFMYWGEGRSEESRAVGNWLTCVVCLPPRAWVNSGPGLLPRPMWSMALLQPGFVLMSAVPVATEGRACSLGQHLRPCWCSRVMLLPGSHRSVWFGLPSGAMVMSISKL